MAFPMPDLLSLIADVVTIVGIPALVISKANVLSGSIGK